MGVYHITPEQYDEMTPDQRGAWFRSNCNTMGFDPILVSDYGYANGHYNNWDIFYSFLNSEGNGIPNGMALTIAQHHAMKRLGFTFLREEGRTLFEVWSLPKRDGIDFKRTVAIYSNRLHSNGLVWNGPVWPDEMRSVLSIVAPESKRKKASKGSVSNANLL